MIPRAIDRKRPGRGAFGRRAHVETIDRPPRLRLIDPAVAPKPLAKAFALLPVINIFRAMANAESLYPYFSQYLLRLFKALELDKALERMIVLRDVKRSGCFYAWRQNIVVARGVEVRDEQIDALERGDMKASCFSEAERAAFALTEVMDLIEATNSTYIVSTVVPSRQISPGGYVLIGVGCSNIVWLAALMVGVAISNRALEPTA